MGASTLERQHAEVVEGLMEGQVISGELIDHDVAERQMLATAHALIREAMETRSVRPLYRADALLGQLEKINEWEDERHDTLPGLFKLGTRFFDALRFLPHRLMMGGDAA